MLTRVVHKKKDSGLELICEPAAAARDEILDPVVKLSALVNLEEVSRRENPSLRVLRCNRSGLSVYVHSSGLDKAAAARCRYVVAYEGEISMSLHVKQILIRGNDASSVWAVLALVERHSQLLYEKLRAAPQASRQPQSKELERLGGFQLSRTRKTVRNALASLSGSELTKDAYEGFVNAVVSLTSEIICQFQPRRDDGLRLLLEKMQGKTGVPNGI